MKTNIRLSILSIIFTLFCLGGFAYSQATDFEESLNRKTYEHLTNFVQSKENNSLKGLTQRQMQKLLQDTSNHPVARLSRVNFYDPEGILGYCFGRAMTSHLLALDMNLASENIAKLFVVGDMKEWQFHVTTLVRSDDGQWYAIDPVIDISRPVTIKEWKQTVKRMFSARGATLNYYLVDSFTMIPNVKIVPDRQEESGEHLIERIFEPRGRSGFDELIDQYGERVFSLDETTQNENFISYDPQLLEVERFNFTHILINNTKFDFASRGTDPNRRHYFVDLMAEFSKSNENNRRRLRPFRKAVNNSYSTLSFESNASDAMVESNNLYSINFSKISK